MISYRQINVVKFFHNAFFMREQIETSFAMIRTIATLSTRKIAASQTALNICFAIYITGSKNKPFQFSSLVQEMGVAPRIARRCKPFRYHAGAGERKHSCLRFSARSTPICITGSKNKPFQFSSLVQEMGVAPRIARRCKPFRYHAGAGERKHSCLRFSARSTPICITGSKKQTFSVFFVGAGDGS